MKILKKEKFETKRLLLTGAGKRDRRKRLQIENMRKIGGISKLLLLRRR